MTWGLSPFFMAIFKPDDTLRIVKFMQPVSAEKRKKLEIMDREYIIAQLFYRYTGMVACMKEGFGIKKIIITGVYAGNL